MGACLDAEAPPVERDENDPAVIVADCKLGEAFLEQATEAFPAVTVDFSDDPAMLYPLNTSSKVSCFQCGESQLNLPVYCTEGQPRNFFCQRCAEDETPTSLKDRHLLMRWGCSKQLWDADSVPNNSSILCKRCGTNCRMYRETAEDVKQEGDCELKCWKTPGDTFDAQHICWTCGLDMMYPTMRSSYHECTLHCVTNPYASLRSHWKCDMCQKSGWGRVMRCDEHGFDVCLSCAALDTLGMTDFVKRRNHKSRHHAHVLIRMYNPYSSSAGESNAFGGYSCNVCKEEQPDHNSYHCRECEFDMCPTCKRQEDQEEADRLAAAAAAPAAATIAATGGGAGPGDGP